MRKLFAVFGTFAAFALLLSGCVSPFGRTTIRYRDVNKYCLSRLHGGKKVGNRDVKFYVKVVDKRKDKRLGTKRNGLIPFVQGSFAMKEKEFKRAVKVATEEALANTGWGVAEDPMEANYTLDLTVDRFTNSYWESGRVISADVCVVNGFDYVLFKKHIHHYVLMVLEPLVHHGVLVVGNLLNDLYNQLIKVFSSPQFVNAVEHRVSKR